VVECRPITVSQNIETEVYCQIRPDTEQISVKRRMVQATQGQSVGENWFALRMTIR